MGNKEQYKQKKLARKKKKAKLKQSNINKAFKGISNNYEQNGIYKCIINESAINQGMCSILLARRINLNKLKVAGFILDLYCLGVKDCFLQAWKIESFNEVTMRKEFHSCSPSKAKKIILESEKYSKNIGFQTHKDYKKALSLFEDIEPDPICEYPFGLNGEPCFINGPKDSEKRCMEIMNVLEKYKKS